MTKIFVLLGEIGCFLSHFLIWEKMVVEQLNEVLVLEDDIRFEPFFRDRALSLLQEARKIGGWDLMYGTNLANPLTFELIQYVFVYSIAVISVGSVWTRMNIG